MSGKENFASPPAHGGAGRTPLQDAENITFRGSEVDLFSPSQDIFSPHITVRKRRRGRRAHQDAEAWASPVPADDDDDDEAPFVPPGLVVERDVAAEPQAAEPAPESAPVLSPCGDAGPEVVALADAEDGDPSASYDPRSPAKPAPNLTCVSLRKVERPAATTRPVSPEKLDFVAELVSPVLASPEAFRDGGLASPAPPSSPEPPAPPAPLRSGRARRSLDALTTFADRTADALPLAEVEFRRATTRDRGVVHPNSSFRRLWDLAAMVAALVVVAGGAPAARARAPRVATFVDAGGSAFFLADVALNFRTGYVSKGTLVLRSGRIAARYASTWLAPDLVTALGHSALVRDGAAALYGAWRGRGEAPEARRCSKGSRDSLFAHCWPPPPSPLQILRNVRGALGARRALQRRGPSFLGATVDAWLWSAAKDPASAVATILRLVKLLVALKCLKWAKLLHVLLRALALARSGRKRADAKRADAAVVRTPAKELRASRTVTRRRGRFSVL